MKLFGYGCVGIMSLMLMGFFGGEVYAATGVTVNNPTPAQGDYTNINNAIGGVGIPEDPEFVEALAWMYTNKITSLGTPSTYRPFDPITREESTKILGRFAKNVLNLADKTEINDQFCYFADSGMIATELVGDVFNACKLGLFRGGNGGFYPKGGLTKAQSLVVLVRLFDNKILPENSLPWFKYYYDRAYELGITKDRDMANFERGVTRYEVALMIYRFNIKYKLLKQFNGQVLGSTQLMGIVPDSVTTNNGLRKGTALFNTDVLTSPNLESLPIDLFGDKYLIKKRKLDNYGVGNSNFIWFGDLYTIDEKTFLGSASFTVLNGYIEEAYIRPTELSNKYYIIKPSSQQPYYSVEEIRAE